MNPTSKKFVSLFLVFSLMMLSVNLFAKERRGAKLLITKKDGQQLQGELITVKPNSLLLLDTEGKDVSVGIADIKVITIVKKSKFLLGAGLGILIVGGLATLFGAIASAGADGWEGLGGEGMTGAKVALSGIIAGLFIGGFFGATTGAGETIQIEGMPSKTIEFYLEKLRKKARVRDYR